MTIRATLKTFTLWKTYIIIPICKQQPFANGESPYVKFWGSISVYIQGLPVCIRGVPVCIRESFYGQPSSLERVTHQRATPQDLYLAFMPTLLPSLFVAPLILHRRSLPHNLACRCCPPPPSSATVIVHHHLCCPPPLSLSTAVVHRCYHLPLLLSVIAIVVCCRSHHCHSAVFAVSCPPLLSFPVLSATVSVCHCCHLWLPLLSAIIVGHHEDVDS